MKDSMDVYEFILDNIKKIIVPETLLKIEQSMTRFELVALLLVEKNEKLTMTGLAQGMAVPMSTATGIVDRLVRKKLVKRERSEEDRRIVDISLTDSGREMVGEIKGYLLQMINRVREMLTGEEFESGLELIRKIVEGFQKIRPETGAGAVPPRRTIIIE